MTRGQRIPGGLASVTRTPGKAAGDVYVVDRRPMPYGHLSLPPGTEIPGALQRPRLEAWVNARVVRRVGPDEEYQRYEDFVDSLHQDPEDAPEEPEEQDASEPE